MKDPRKEYDLNPLIKAFAAAILFLAVAAAIGNYIAELENKPRVATTHEAPLAPLATSTSQEPRQDRPPGGPRSSASADDWNHRQAYPGFIPATVCMATTGECWQGQ